MQLGQPESVSVLDNHQGRLGNVDSDLDHRGADQGSDGSITKALDRAVLGARVHAAMQNAHGQTGKRSVGQFLGSFHHRAPLSGAFYPRTDHVHPLTFGQHLAGAVVGVTAPCLGHDFSRHFTARRSLIEHGEIQVAIQSQGQGARNGSCCHCQEVRRWPLAQQKCALKHTESLLLIDHGKAQAMKRHRILEHRMRSNHHARPTVGNKFPVVAPSSSTLPTGKQRHLVTLGGVQFVGTFPPLKSQHLGRRKDNHLVAALDDRGCDEQGHDGFACSYVALEQPLHDKAASQVLINFHQRPFLSRREPKWQRAGKAAAQRTAARQGGAGTTASLAHFLAPSHERYLQDEQVFPEQGLVGRMTALTKSGDVIGGVGEVQ